MTDKKPPAPAAVETEIFDFFAGRNFERSRRFGAGAYDPQPLRDFLVKLGNPQYGYKTIHVAGTVGKGSATTYLARSLAAMGFKTGSYLSPHFLSLTERFCVNGNPISAEGLASLWHELKQHSEIKMLSFFDTMTALAFLFFLRQGCDWTVIETGLGGRLDSTNNLRAAIAVITLIDWDHQNILGDSLEAIAREKAGIIYTGQTVYSMKQAEAVDAVLRHACTERQASYKVISTPAEDYLRSNQEFAWSIIADAFHPGPELQAKVRSALQQPVFGRLSLLNAAPRVFFDGGHNVAAMRALTAFINAQDENTCNIFLNTMTERNLPDFEDILRKGIQKNQNYFFFPMTEKNYFASPPAGSALRQVTDDKIRAIITIPGQLNLFTGSMGIYKELKSRFDL